MGRPPLPRRHPRQVAPADREHALAPARRPRRVTLRHALAPSLRPREALPAASRRAPRLCRGPHPRRTQGSAAGGVRPPPALDVCDARPPRGARLQPVRLDRRGAMPARRRTSPLRPAAAAQAHWQRHRQRGRDGSRRRPLGRADALWPQASPAGQQRHRRLWRLRHIPGPRAGAQAALPPQQRDHRGFRRPPRQAPPPRAHAARRRQDCARRQPVQQEEPQGGEEGAQETQGGLNMSGPKGAYDGAVCTERRLRTTARQHGRAVRVACADSRAPHLEMTERSSRVASI
mmetsp:Transcript_41231/g.120536  ORF Transcript_41231/g.120536 Transcript_41231/m.120536 type:complete len:289 (+) Transcript_41231:735-1601(+)